MSERSKRLTEEIFHTATDTRRQGKPVAVEFLQKNRDNFIIQTDDPSITRRNLENLQCGHISHAGPRENIVEAREFLKPNYGGPRKFTEQVGENDVIIGNNDTLYLTANALWSAIFRREVENAILVPVTQIKVLVASGEIELPREED